MSTERTGAAQLGSADRPRAVGRAAAAAARRGPPRGRRRRGRPLARAALLAAPPGADRDPRPAADRSVVRRPLRRRGRGGAHRLGSVGGSDARDRPGSVDPTAPTTSTRWWWLGVRPPCSTSAVGPAGWSRPCSVRAGPPWASTSRRSRSTWAAGRAARCCGETWRCPLAGGGSLGDGAAAGRQHRHRRRRTGVAATLSPDRGRWWLDHLRDRHRSRAGRGVRGGVEPSRVSSPLRSRGRPSASVLWSGSRPPST